MRDDESPQPLSPDDEARVTAFLAGELPGTERRAFEDRILHDAALADAVYAQHGVEHMVRAAHRPAVLKAVALAPAARSRPRHAWTTQLLWAAAASVVIAAGGWQSWERLHARRVLRGAAAACVAVSPIGAVPASPARFVWTRDPRASAYRFELRDAESHLIADIVSADTFALAPADVPRRGWWTVTPLRNDLELSPPVLTEFRVGR